MTRVLALKNGWQKAMAYLGKPYIIGLRNMSRTFPIISHTKKQLNIGRNIPNI